MARNTTEGEGAQSAMRGASRQSDAPSQESDRTTDSLFQGMQGAYDTLRMPLLFFIERMTGENLSDLLNNDGSLKEVVARTVSDKLATINKDDQTAFLFALEAEAQLRAALKSPGDGAAFSQATLQMTTGAYERTLAALRTLDEKMNSPQMAVERALGDVARQKQAAAENIRAKAELAQTQQRLETFISGLAHTFGLLREHNQESRIAKPSVDRLEVARKLSAEISRSIESGDISTLKTLNGEANNFLSEDDYTLRMYEGLAGEYVGNIERERIDSANRRALEQCEAMKEEILQLLESRREEAVYSQEDCEAVAREVDEWFSEAEEGKDPHRFSSLRLSVVNKVEELKRDRDLPVQFERANTQYHLLSVTLGHFGSLEIADADIAIDDQVLIEKIMDAQSAAMSILERSPRTLRDKKDFIAAAPRFKEYSVQVTAICHRILDARERDIERGEADLRARGITL